MDSSSIFVSYRHGSDGDRLVSRVAALLRCSGLRPWIDHVDTGAGAIDQRILDGLERAAGGVLIVTDDLVNSNYIRDKELPRMIQRVAEQRLPMMVVNNYRDPATGEIDVRKPDEIVQSATDIPLVDITQADVDSVEGQGRFVYGFLRRHAEHWVEEKMTHLTLFIQTGPGDAVPQSDLEMSFEESDESIPADEYRRALAVGLPELARACQRAQITSLAVAGGARLSVAVTLGAMFPRQGKIDRLTINEDWGNPEKPDPEVHGIEQTELPHADDDGDSVAVFIKLKKTGDSASGNDHAFTRLAAQLRPRRCVRLDLTGDGFIDPGEGSRLGAQIGRIITSITDEADTPRVHLCFIGPFTMGVLIGRELNRLHTTVYEYLDDTSTYLPLFRLRPSARRQPITAISHRQDTFDELHNLTPHAVTLLSEDDETIASWPAAERWARLAEHADEQSVHVGSTAIPSAQVRYGGPVDLPPVREGVGLIVPRVLAEKVRRPDLLFPGGEVRDESGAIVGCRRLDSYKGQE